MPSMPLPTGARYLSLPQVLDPGGSATIADIRSGSFMSPLQPLTQMTPTGTKPRQFGITPGYNMIWQPKGDEMYGFWILREFADNCDLFRIIVDALLDRLCSGKWEIRLLAKPGEPQKKLEERSANDPRLAALTTFFRKPDGVTPFSKWLRTWYEDSTIIDAAAIYKERDLKGRIASFRVLDGASINRRVTEQAFTPPPPSVAYQQILYGTIWANFTTDDLHYVMKSPRSWKVYGFGQVEKCMTHVGIALRRQAFLADYYTSGNMPEAMCFLPADVPIDRVKEFQDWFDTILAGDLTNRRRLRFLPGFGKMGEKVSPNVIFPKEVLLKDPLDEWLFQMFCYNLGMPPSAMLKTVNRATAEQNAESAEEEGMEPKKADIKETIDDLIQSPSGLGYPDIEFSWARPIEMDALKQAEVDEIYINTGVRTRNKVRQNLGEDPDPSPEADKLTITTKDGIIPLDQADHLTQIQNRQDITTPPDDGSGDDNSPPGKKKPKVGKLLATEVLGSRRLLRAREAKISPDRTSKAITKAHERIESAVRRVFTRQKETAEKELRKLVKTTTFGRRAMLDGLTGTAKLKAFARTLRKDEDEKTPREVADAVYAAISKEFAAMTPDVAAALREAAIDGVNRGLIQIDVSDSDMIAEVNSIAGNWASKRAAELVGMKYTEDGELVENPRAKYAINGTTRDELRRIIKEAFEAETMKDDLIADVQGAGIFSDSRATMIARTEVSRAQTQGNFEIWKQSGLVKSVRWQISDDNPCPVCELNDDVVRKLGDEFPSGDIMPQVHPNAVFGGSLFAPYGAVERMVSAKYNGLAISLRAGIYGTTIGPNHPMLTDRGLVAAKLLKVGDKLVCDLSRIKSVPVASDAANFDQMIRVENAFEALAAVFPTARIARSADDFHGDVVNDEVKVVLPERRLLLEYKSHGLERFRESGFEGTDVKTEAEARFGPELQGAERILLPSPGGMGGSNVGHFVLLSIDEIMETTFTGDAFDCTTQSSLYCSDGFVVSNCACVLIAVEFNE